MPLMSNCFRPELQDVVINQQIAVENQLEMA